MDDPVQAQYEAYPYPARDPRDEARRLVTGSPSELSELNHYLFAGRRDFRRPFRALVAGGGTGDAAIMLGQQLAERGGLGEVVYLDVAATARRTAEARASARGLTNISFVTGALQDLPDLGLGRFDYIDCCGVLHHLEDPTAGLGALAAVLDERGGMGLMLYGEYGRTGVYPMQAMLQGLGRDLPLERKVVLARRLLAALPKTNWLRHNRHLGDHEKSDAELADLFLHARDRAFTVPQLAQLVRSAELEIVAFIEPARYEPTTYLGDPVVLEQLEGLGQLERAGFAEALAGNIKKHLFYAAKRGTSQGRLARPDRPEAVPVLGRLPAARLAEALRREAVLKVDLDGVALSLPMPELAAEIVARIDGKTSLAKLHRALQKGRPAVDWLAFKAAFDSLYEALGGLNHLWIAYPRSDQ
jgi:SAM-dependent methyltransferase